MTDYFLSGIRKRTKRNRIHPMRAIRGCVKIIISISHAI